MPKRQENRKKGKVFLLGSGPGDPGLMTMRAVELLQEADVVVFDHLPGEKILAMIPEQSEKVDAGKFGSRHKLEQDEINELLVKLAEQGKQVVRLKGGDPYLFGRGGEEAKLLHDSGIDFEIVPGVSSVTAVPALAGILLTHRDYASLVTMVTGHDGPDKKGERVDWRSIAKTGGTIVILMGVKNLGRIADELVKGGLAAETPVAIIERGTWDNERVTIGALDTIEKKAAEAGVKPPAIIVIGKVVSLREELGMNE